MHSQKWEVAAACFQHLELVLDLASRSTVPPGPNAHARQPPGFMVLHDLLAGGHTMQAILHILLPGYQELAAVRPLTLEGAGAAAGGMGGVGGGNGTQLLTNGASGAAGGGLGGAGAGFGGFGAGAPFGGGADGSGAMMAGFGAAGAAAAAYVSPLLQPGEADVLPVKEAAVQAALRVLTAALRMDGAFLSALGRLYSHDRCVCAVVLHGQPPEPLHNFFSNEICFEVLVESNGGVTHTYRMLQVPPP